MREYGGYKYSESEDDISNILDTSYKNSNNNQEYAQYQNNKPKHSRSNYKQKQEESAE